MNQKNLLADLLFSGEALSGRSLLPIPKYPPYNLITSKDPNGRNRFLIEIATAGFELHELEVEHVTYPDNTITVRGKKKDVFGEEHQKEYLHQGLARRDFELTFKLDKYIESAGSSYADGILRISLEKKIPEDQKPKILEIKKR